MLFKPRSVTEESIQPRAYRLLKERACNRHLVRLRYIRDKMDKSHIARELMYIMQCFLANLDRTSCAQLQGR